jgi:hypothetical protein
MSNIVKRANVTNISTLHDEIVATDCVYQHKYGRRQRWISTMDFIDGLPLSSDKHSILVVVDRFTRYAHFVALKHPYTASSVARSFFHEVDRLRGIPNVIITDRDRVFLSLFWKELFTLQGTTLLEYDVSPTK